ncbi:MAG: hypothetical protein QM775_00335 [Pirellulales bacterium]
MREVLRGVAATGQMFEHRHKPALVAQHELLEGRGVVVAHLEHQPHVRVAELVTLGRRFTDGQTTTREFA